MGKLKNIAQAARRRALLPPLRKAGRLLLGYDLITMARRCDELSAKIHRLTQRVDGLTRTLDLLVDSPKNQWLYKNRVERMDATVELFDAGRREFHLARYRFAASHVTDHVVADIACGTGYGTALLLREGNARRAIGVDIDPETTEYARATHKPAGVDYRCASGDRTGLADRSIDVVVSFETIEHVPSDTALLAEFDRILRPGGKLIVSTPNNWPLERAPHHVRVYKRSSFEAVLSRHFSDLRLFNQNSGSVTAPNGDRPAGIQPTTEENAGTAECFIAVCTRS